MCPRKTTLSICAWITCFESKCGTFHTYHIQCCPKMNCLNTFDTEPPMPCKICCTSFEFHQFFTLPLGFLRTPAMFQHLESLEMVRTHSIPQTLCDWTGKCMVSVIQLESWAGAAPKLLMATITVCLKPKT